jgi:hypothetical protein
VRLVTADALVVVAVIAGHNLRLGRRTSGQLQVAAETQAIAGDLRDRLLWIGGVRGERSVAGLAADLRVLVVFQQIGALEGRRLVVGVIVSAGVAILASGAAGVGDRPCFDLIQGTGPIVPVDSEIRWDQRPANREECDKAEREDQRDAQDVTGVSKAIAHACPRLREQPPAFRLPECKR